MKKGPSRDVKGLSFVRKSVNQVRLGTVMNRSNQAGMFTLT